MTSIPNIQTHHHSTATHATHTTEDNPDSAKSTDGSHIFPNLWRYFLRHQHLRDWLMRASPFSDVSFGASQIEQGIAFCCNFSVPQLWSDMASCFNVGEIFIPDHSFANFVCGSVVAASTFNQHLVCALGPAAARTPAAVQAYSTTVRRMIIDMASSTSIRIIEFSWMADGALMVAVRALTLSNHRRSVDNSGCTGAFAVFTDVTPAGNLPAAPRFLVSFVETPRCPTCIQIPSLGCYCFNTPCKNALSSPAQQLSTDFQPYHDHNISVSNGFVATYDNIRNRFRMISRIAHVKVTAHLVTTRHSIDVSGQTVTTYRLGPSRFVVKAVQFRASDPSETRTLQQNAAKLLLFRSGPLQFAQKLNMRPTIDLATQGSSQGNMLCLNDVGDFDSGREKFPTYLTPTAERESVSMVDEKTNGDSTFVNSTIDVLSMITNSFETAVATDGFTAKANEYDWEIKESREASRHDYGSLTVTRLTCPKCDKTFSQQGSLNRHLKNIHEQRKIPCDYCHMTFGQMFDLKVS